MPVASKRKTEAHKTAPIIEVEVEPKPDIIEEAPPPKVTALIFSYDSAPALRRCLAALEASNNRQQMEILVVDAGSHDESPQLDSEFEGVTILRLPRYFGRTKALNIGTRTAAGDYLFFLSPEVEVLPTTIPELIAVLESDPDIVAVCPFLLDSETRPAPQFYRLPTPATGAALVPLSPAVSADRTPVEGATFQALFVRKYFVKGLNYLDERYGDSWADVELCYQIRRSSRTVVVAGRTTALYTPGSPYSKDAKTIIEADRIHGAASFYAKHYGFLAGLTVRLKAAFAAIFRLQLGLAAAILSGSKIDGSQNDIL